MISYKYAGIRNSLAATCKWTSAQNTGLRNWRCVLNRLSRLLLNFRTREQGFIQLGILSLVLKGHAAFASNYSSFSTYNFFIYRQSKPNIGNTIPFYRRLLPPVVDKAFLCEQIINKQTLLLARMITNADGTISSDEFWKELCIYSGWTSVWRTMKLADTSTWMASITSSTYGCQTSTFSNMATSNILLTPFTLLSEYTAMVLSTTQQGEWKKIHLHFSKINYTVI